MHLEDQCPPGIRRQIKLHAPLKPEIGHKFWTNSSKVSDDIRVEREVRLLTLISKGLAEAFRRVFIRTSNVLRPDSIPEIIPMTRLLVRSTGEGSRFW